MFFLCYSTQLFHELLCVFLNNNYQPKTCAPTASKKVVYLSLPYFGQVSVKIKKKKKIEKIHIFKIVLNCTSLVNSLPVNCPHC